MKESKRLLCLVLQTVQSNAATIAFSVHIQGESVQINTYNGLAWLGLIHYNGTLIVI
jgi:hypothetical protein